VLVEHFGSFHSESLDNIAIDSSSGNAYVVMAESDMVEVFGTAVVPTPITGGSSNEQSTSATVEGAVDPNGAEVTGCKFEYGTSTAYEQPPASCRPSASKIGSGTNPVTVTAELTGLIPNQVYDYRLAAENASAVSRGTNHTFATLAVPPVVDDRPPSASMITDKTVVLSGTVNPEHDVTTYRFAYVEAAAYEPDAVNPYAAGLESREIGAGEGYGDETVESGKIVGLRPGTTYHYALLATNGAGTEIGLDHEFTTAPLTLPVIGAGEAIAIGPTSATIVETIDPRNLPTSYELELATEVTCGGGEASCTGPNAVYNGGKTFGYAGFGDGAGVITIGLQGLLPGTLYHFRLVAHDENGTSYGPDGTFATPGIPLPFVRSPIVPALPLPSFPQLFKLHKNHRHKTKHRTHTKRRRGQTTGRPKSSRVRGGSSKT
jgi:hypothetical protein